MRSPTNPVRAAAFDTAGSVTSVDADGNHVYLAHGVADLRILDVSDPGKPSFIGSFVSDGFHDACGFEPTGHPATRVWLQSQLAYSAGDNGLNVLDVSDPASISGVNSNFC